MFDSNSKYGTNIVGCKGLQFKLYMWCAIQRFSNLMCLYFRDSVAFMSFLHAFSCYVTSLEVLRLFHVVINLFLLLVLCCCFLCFHDGPKSLSFFSDQKQFIKSNILGSSVSQEYWIPGSHCEDYHAGVDS
jgi:hypothetical protein